MARTCDQLRNAASTQFSVDASENTSGQIFLGSVMPSADVRGPAFMAPTCDRLRNVASAQPLADASGNTSDQTLPSVLHIQHYVSNAPSILREGPLTRSLTRWRTELDELQLHQREHPECWANTAEELRAEADWLLSGLQEGFQVIHLDQQPAPYAINNYVADQEDIIAADLEEELTAHRMFEVQDPPRWQTPMFVKDEGLQPDGSKKYRVIRDYSINNPALRRSDLFRSINDAAWHFTFPMMSVDDAIAHMRPGCFMAKIDIKKAFRTVPVHPSNWEHLGTRLRKRFFIDLRLPFGLKNAPEIFTRITKLVMHFMRRRGIDAIVVYIDDFWISAQTMTDCQAAYDCLMELLQALGFTVSVGKCIPPARDIIFLGIRLQSDSDGAGTMLASVPMEKLAQLRTLCTSALARSSLTVHQAQSLLGKLSAVARVVFAGRAFVRRICDCIRDAEALGISSISVSNAFRADLHFWIKYATLCNGQALLLRHCELHPLYFSTDASLLGIGGFLDGDFFHASFSNLRRHASPAHSLDAHLWPGAAAVPSHIGYNELFAIWWALVLWGPRLRGLHVRLFVDNQNAVVALRQATHRNPFYMHIIRRIYWIMASEGFRLYPEYIPSLDNTLADILSREGPTERFYTERHLWSQRVDTVPRLSIPSRDARLCVFTGADASPPNL